jgi:large subunit ribosomal protein L15
MDILSHLKRPEGATASKRRVGRGVGSGLGKTAGKGQKGQRARTGGKGKVGFEGGQMPLQRRVPKRGFRNTRALRVAEVTLSALRRFADGTDVTVELLRAGRLVRGAFDRIKVLGTGDLDRKLTVHAHAFTPGALAKIEQAGGKVVVLKTGRPANGEEPAAS